MLIESLWFPYKTRNRKEIGELKEITGKENIRMQI